MKSSSKLKTSFSGDLRRPSLETLPRYVWDSRGVRKETQQTLKTKPHPLNIAKGQHNDREMMLQMVAQSGWALGDAAVELRKDREVVMTAVTQEGWALQYATDELRGDREVAMKAVAQNGLALRYAINELRETVRW